MHKKGVVYKVTHKESGEVYIGATTKSIEERKKDHIKNSKKGKTYAFQHAIATHGAEAFKWEQIDTAFTTDELAQKEKDYILKYNSKEEGYNVDCVGSIQKTIYQYDFKGTLINTFSSLESAGNAVNATKSAIGKACNSDTKSCKGYIWNFSFSFPNFYKDDRRKNVLQLTIDGELLKEFESVSEASKQTNFNKTSIAKVCRGERKSCGGCFWRYN